MKLQQIIYRDLLVVARALDRSAAFRALISSNLLVRPSVDDQANANNKAVQPHADAFNRDVLSFLQNRSYYLPSSNRPSVEAIVRDRFRSNPSDPKLAIDTAFVALKALNDRLAHAIETGVIDVRDVGPAAFQTKPKPRRMTVSFQRAKLVKERTISQALRDEAIEKPMPLTVRLAESVTTGVFLLAHPLLDGIFNRSVIVLTDHSLVKGTKGFIVNHSTKVPLRKRFNVDKRILSAFGLSKVRKGGPVPTEYAEVLHRRAELGGDRVVSSNFKTTMDDDLYSGINLDAAAKAFEAGTLQRSDVVFMNGMSSWMPGQLDDELQRGAWVAVRAPLSVAVSAKKSLWNEMMARLGGEYEAFSRMPSVSDDDDFDDEEDEDDDDDEAAGGPRGK